MIRPECIKSPTTIRRRESPSFIPADRPTSSMRGQVIGYLGELHPDVADQYEIGEKADVAVLDMRRCFRSRALTGNIRESPSTRR